MAISKLHYINTGKDGVLDHTNQEDVDRLFDDLATKRKIVLHFHGGLVSEASGMAAAERLERDCYGPSGAHSVFFVWEAGLIEIVKHNVTEIFGEDIFKILLKWVLKFAAGKLEEAGAGKSPALQTPTDMDVYRELAKNDAQEEPFRNWPVSDNTTEITEAEQRAFENALATDNDFQETVRAITNSLVPETKTDGAKGLTVRTRRSVRTLMSPEVVEQLKEDAENASRAGGKGIFATAKLIKLAAEILIRVVRRFTQHRDHGIYPTVVEEILRQLYVANIGAAIWGAMKKETEDTFQEASNPPPRGGWYFAKKLQALLAAGGTAPEITLVGHSTGAVFINNLLTHVAQMQKDETNPLPKDFAFKNIVLLAPACTFEHFLPSITKHRNLFRNFRMFTMTDEAESRDMLVPYVYTRSLLYFISGALEPASNGAVDFDKPIVGMNRYYEDRNKVYGFPEIKTAQDFIKSGQHSVVWSPSAPASGSGLSSNSLKHGDFDNDPNTLASVRYILEN